MARSTARKRALNTLYEADEKGQDFLSLLDERIAQPGAQTPLPEYAIEIVRGVDEHRRDIDSQLNTHSTGWKVKRMGVEQTAVFKAAETFARVEGILPAPESSHAIKVAIDEALNLSKTLSDDAAPSFIHGVLSAIVAAKDKQSPQSTPLDDSDKDESDQTN